MLFVFCACLYLLIVRNKKIPVITIDREYFGKDAVIKEILLEMLGRREKIPEIYFGFVGRKVQAHLRGYQVYTGKLSAKKVFSLAEAIKAIKKTEVGSRLKEA